MISRYGLEGRPVGKGVGEEQAASSAPQARDPMGKRCDWAGLRAVIAEGPPGTRGVIVHNSATFLQGQVACAQVQVQREFDLGFNPWRARGVGARQET